MKKRSVESLKQQQRNLEHLRARVNAAKIAYLNRTPFDDRAELSYDDLRTIAKQFIQASYEYQKSKYGSVQVRISAAKLLRR